MIDIQDLLSLPQIAALMVEKSQEDKTITPLKPATLRYYVTQGKRSRLPYLPTIFMGNQRFATRTDTLAWIDAYKTAPKLGRRGNGSKQPKKVQSIRASNGQNKGK